MKLHGKRGFTILAVLVIATVLYSLLSLTLASGYALHRRNTRLKHALQQRSRSNVTVHGQVHRGSSP